mgnify:CR=1 FL=1
MPGCRQTSGSVIALHGDRLCAARACCLSCCHPCRLPACLPRCPRPTWHPSPLLVQVAFEAELGEVLAGVPELPAAPDLVDGGSNGSSGGAAAAEQQRPEGQ